MELKLERPLLFFDIESTGLSVAKDSIIELSFVKILPDGEQRVKTWRIRPWIYAGEPVDGTGTMKIPAKEGRQKKIDPGAEKVHGIHDEDLRACPRFCDLAEELASWVKDSDLAGFNSTKFDLPLLAEEFERVTTYTTKKLDINLHDKKMVDVQSIYHQMEPRNLKTAYKFYCGGDLDKAHEAEADTIATYEVLKAQLDKYENLPNDVNVLSNQFKAQNSLDYAGRLKWNEANEAVITFGKHINKTAREVYRNEPSYFSWIETGDFTLDTKRQFRILKEQFRAESNRPLNDAQLAGATNRLANKFNAGRNGGGTLFD
ncbi:MAG: 3'-5' exonuclease [Bacteroidales bacterium]|nr:3'-5' exonuclease [Bacteroidales bacterium]